MRRRPNTRSSSQMARRGPGRLMWCTNRSGDGIALPTGQLASEMRAVHPEIDVDTSHGAFLLHRPLQEAMAILTQYDLVVVDEVSMLTAGHFEHILALWKYADQLPCLVLLGDFWQLPVVDKTAERCEQSAAWAGHVKTIPFREQVRCKCPALQAKLDILRTAVPSMQQLKKILRGHRAWTTRTYWLRPPGALPAA